MAFCKYCGNQLEDGQQCNCEGAQAAREAAANTQQVETVQQTAQQTVQQPKQAAASADNIGADLGMIFSKFFTAPVEMFEKIYTQKSSAAAFIVFAIFFGVTFILSCVQFAPSFRDYGATSIGIGVVGGLFFTIGKALVKLGYASAAHIFRDDKDAKYVKALALFAVTTLPIMAFKLFACLFSKIGFYSGTSWVSSCVAVIDAVYTYLAFTVVMKQNRTKRINVFVVTTLIVALGFAILMAADSAIEDAIRNAYYIRSYLY